MTKPTVLVTGGAGYIGSHACAALDTAGFTPVAYDNLEYGHRESVKWGPLEHGDICTRQRLDEVIARHRPVAIMHFAAYAYVGESMQHPGKYYRNNVVGTMTLLEAALAGGIQNFIFSSSCATYGIPDNTLAGLTEDTPQRPISPYGASKLMGERIILDFCAAYPLRSVILRYFNAAGAHPEYGIGESHCPETHLIPLVLESAAGRFNNLSVYGNDYPTPDGSCIRDYIHVCDLADAHVLSTNHLLAGGASEIFNLGSGSGFSVFDVINEARAATTQGIPFEVRPRRPGDPAALFANAGKAKEVLGWSPRFASLRIIIEHAWRWHSSKAY